MTNSIVALVTILGISAFTFLYLNKSLKPIVDAKDYKVWLYGWAGLTTISFLAPSLFLLFALCGGLIVILSKKVENKIALYFALLFVIPGFALQTPLMNINFQRILSMVILFPLFLSFVLNKKTEEPPRTMANLYLPLYLLLTWLLTFRGIFVTPDQGFVLSYPMCIKMGFDFFFDFYVPYFVISRYIRTFDQLKTALVALVTICIILAPLAIFEISTSQLLYKIIPIKLDANWVVGEVFRSNMLRASASIEHPLYLGMLMMIGLGLYAFARNLMTNKLLYLFGLCIICAGLIAPLSKGPWTGTAIMFVILYLFSAHKLKNGAITLVLLTTTVIFVLNSGYSEKIISLLPFVGNVDTGNVDYRGLLFEQSLLIIEEFPIFGMYDPTKHKAMLPLFQGDGIVDLVNLYVTIAMMYGIPALLLYLAFLGSVTLNLVKELLIMEDKRSIEYKCGQSFIAILFGMFLLMATVANAIILNAILFALCGLIVAYTHILKQKRNKPFDEVETYSTSRIVK